MNLAFLCPQQRQRMYQRPHVARDLWDHYVSYVQVNDVIPCTAKLTLYGNALEAATLYLNHSQDRRSHLLARYSDTAVRLIETLSALKQPRLGIAVACISTLTLERMRRTGADPRAVCLGQRRFKHITENLQATVAHPSEGNSQDPKKRLETHLER